MGLDVYLSAIVGYKASDIVENVLTQTKKFPKRDEITGEVIPGGGEIKVVYTKVELKNGTEFLVGENRVQGYYQDKPILDWSKIFGDAYEKLVHTEDYSIVDLDRIYFGVSLGTGNSNRSGDETSITIDEEKASELKKEVKETLEKFLGSIKKTPEIIAFNIFSY
jgi:hypothetical protein